MATRIPQRELRNSNAEILRRVQAGERFVVTRNGVAVADVIPHVESISPPMFPRTATLVSRRRTAGGPPLDRQGWIDDIRDVDHTIEDDPFDGRA